MVVLNPENEASKVEIRDDFSRNTSEEETKRIIDNVSRVILAFYRRKAAE